MAERKKKQDEAAELEAVVDEAAADAVAEEVAEAAEVEAVVEEAAAEAIADEVEVVAEIEAVVEEAAAEGELTPAEAAEVEAAVEEAAAEEIADVVAETEVVEEAVEEAAADAVVEDVEAAAELQEAIEDEVDAETATDAAPAEAPAKRKKKRLPRALRPARTRPTRTPSTERKPIVRLEPPEQERGRRQERQGTVVSDAMDKTIVVRVEIAKAHRRYKKVVRRSVKFHAHDERGEAKVGDVVRIVETRPLSKTKRWRLAEVVEAAK